MTHSVALDCIKQLILVFSLFFFMFLSESLFLSSILFLTKQ